MIKQKFIDVKIIPNTNIEFNPIFSAKLIILQIRVE